MVHRRQLQIEVLKKVNIKGRARFMDNTAARNLDSAIAKKTLSEATLRRLGLTPETSWSTRIASCSR